MKLVQKPDLNAKLQIEKNVCLSGFFQKIFSGIYLHDNYWINDKKNQKCLHIHSMNPSPCGPLASVKKTTPYSNQEKSYDFFFQHEKM